MATPKTTAAPKPSKTADAAATDVSTILGPGEKVWSDEELEEHQKAVARQIQAKRAAKVKECTDKIADLLATMAKFELTDADIGYSIQPAGKAGKQAAKGGSSSDDSKSVRAALKDIAKERGAVSEAEIDAAVGKMVLKYGKDNKSEWTDSGKGSVPGDIISAFKTGKKAALIEMLKG